MKWEKTIVWNVENQIGFIGDKKYKCIASSYVEFPYWRVNVDVYKPQ